MSKATANRAIDFNRLFAVKDKMASDAAESGLAAKRRETGRGKDSADECTPPLDASSTAADEAPVLEFAVGPEAPVSPIRSEPAPVAVAASVVTQLLPPLPDGHQEFEAAEPPGALRVGLPRPLHQRVRAAAAMASQPPTALVRDLLESTAPHFERTAPLSELAQRARDALPENGLGRRSIDVRMQVPVTEDLHRRLVQLAALRAQTLGECLLDVLEHRLPR